VKIYIGNLPRQVDDKQFHDLVAAFGEPDVAGIVKDRATGESQGFGFAEFSNPEHAQAAIDALNQRDMNGNLLVVNKALPARDARFTASGVRGSKRE
jgi:RNA recognition motif-containing protein